MQRRESLVQLLWSYLTKPTAAVEGVWHKNRLLVSRISPNERCLWSVTSLIKMLVLLPEECHRPNNSLLKGTKSCLPQHKWPLIKDLHTNKKKKTPAHPTKQKLTCHSSSKRKTWVPPCTPHVATPHTGWRYSHSAPTYLPKSWYPKWGIGVSQFGLNDHKSKRSELNSWYRTILRQTWDDSFDSLSI